MGAEQLKARVQELEIQLAFQEDLNRRLDGTVVALNQELQELRRQLLLLIERVEQLDSGGAGSAADDPPPPHY